MILDTNILIDLYLECNLRYKKPRYCSELNIYKGKMRDVSRFLNSLYV